MKSYFQIVLISILIIFLFALGCKKKANTSFWQVNNENFSSNQINLSNSPGGTGFSTKSQENGFSMAFFPGGGLPNGGSYNIGGDPTNHQNIGMEFYYHSKRYIPSQPGSTKMQASSLDGKATLTIPATWFKRLEYNSALVIIPTDDSVLIQGILSEP